VVLLIALRAFAAMAAGERDLATSHRALYTEHLKARGHGRERGRVYTRCIPLSSSLPAPVLVARPSQRAPPLRSKARFLHCRFAFNGDLGHLSGSHIKGHACLMVGEWAGQEGFHEN